MRRSLTRDERLRAGSDIRRLFKKGRRIDVDGLRLLYDCNGTARNRMAVVVARGCPGAVRRNREKRITREAYRALKQYIPPGHDLMFFIGSFGDSFGERFSLMKQLLSRAGFHEHAH